MKENPVSSIASDGSRNFVHPADVKGRFATLRQVAFIVLPIIFVVLPLIKIGGKPAVFFHLSERKFYLFGLTFNAQDTWLMMFFTLVGVFGLLFITILVGRVWCGYACPQTVFLEGWYRRVERWIEGPRAARIRRNKGPWNRDKILRKGIKHLCFIILSIVIAHVAVSYFVSATALLDMVKQSPFANGEVFFWALFFTVLLYGNFAWFREQFCVIVCPYGRLQSVLLDDDSLIVGYDEKRGEPRGKKNKEGTGDCVDCKRCVNVCPTGIDIRNGLQMECIACSGCVDACDEIMVKLGRPKGLIRYDSLAGLSGKKKRVIRPRVLLYGVMAVASVVALGFALQTRTTLDVKMLRQRGAPYTVLDDGSVVNRFELHVVNKSEREQSYRVAPLPWGDEVYQVDPQELTIGSLKDGRVVVTVQRSKRGAVVPSARVKVVSLDGDVESTVVARFLSP